MLLLGAGLVLSMIGIGLLIGKAAGYARLLDHLRSWWAIVTLATVGYGDIVPQTAWGRVFGSVVIVIGITFLSFLTATVTSYFVTAQQERSAEHERELREADQEAEAVLLRRIDERLAAIEARLEQRDN
jgi:voltage-gated potassium channel